MNHSSASEESIGNEGEKPQLHSSSPIPPVQNAGSVDPDRYLTLNGVKLYIEQPPMSDGDIEAIKKGQWESSESALVRSVLKSGDRVIEGGACLGHLSILMARLVGPENVFAFEANPEAIRVAQRNFALNEMNVSLTNAVLLNRIHYNGPGHSTPFYVSNAVVSSTTLTGHGRPISVPALCLEDEIARRRCNVLMLDIEGGEVDLLCSADLTFVDKIIMETHYRKAGRTQINRMVRWLYLQGFVIDLALSGREVVYLHRGLDG